MIYALDTNIISYWLQKNMRVAERLNGALRKGHVVVIPPSTFYEIRRGFKHTPAPGKEFAFTLMCQSYKIEEMDLTAWEEAATIYAKKRKTGQMIDDNDILVAAFCIVNGYTLVTHNTKHFQHIDGLLLEDWAEPHD